jgi:formate dehydrogenase major subunit
MKSVKVIINGKEITAATGKTILEVVRENNLDQIPTLCHDDRVEPFGSCFLCVVEIKGLNRLVPSCSTVISEGMVITTNNTRIENSRKTALELILSNHYADCIGPCIDACPASVDAQGYIALISMGKYAEALRLIKEKNPFPLSIGRVCVRNCEDVCRRCYVDDPVAINYLKRYVADIDLEKQWIPELKPKTGKKVAIVGGGPAGLTTAYYLSLEGHSCTILEKLPKLGGMLRYGIPSYRLPREVLDAEIKWITDLGIEVKTQVEMGKDFSIESLKKEGFDSVFLGVGAHKASSMRLEHEDEIDGVYRGIDFLREIETKGKRKLHGIVIIVGGGNTAIDAARTSLRLGADKVKIVYRRSIDEMPAHHAEIEAVQDEGIEILILTNPKSIIAENDKLTGIECLKMKLLASDNGGRPRPIPIEGSEYVLNCDYLIGAIGQGVDTSYLAKEGEVKQESWGTLVVNEETMETSLPGVFSGGDVVTGPLTAVSSIGQGRKAAMAMNEYLKNGTAKGVNFKFYSFKHKLGNLTDDEFSHYKKAPRIKMPELSIADRTQNFKEVELGITNSQSVDEPMRCLECGCSEYYDCSLRKYADEYKVNITDYTGEVRKFKVDNNHPFISLDPNKCINCGLCIRTCSEILKVSALGFVNRGFKSVMKPAMEKPLLETNCISCGNCIDVCPTGAIREKYPFKVLGTLPKENKKTICNFCSLGCNVNYKVINNEIFYISNTTEEVINAKNDGYLCVKGRFANRYLMGNQKVENPSIKINGTATEIGLDESLEYSVTKIKEIVDQYGPESVAFFGSPKMSNEELYLLQKMARKGIGTNNISSFSNLLNNVEVDGLDELTGATVSTTSIDKIDNADVIVLVNSNLSEENLIMELKIKAAQKKGSKLVLINSSEIKLTKFADLWLDTTKGSNTILINGLLKEIAGLIGEQDKALNEMISIYDAETVCGFTGIDPLKYSTFVEMLSNPSDNVVFVYNLDSVKEKAKNDLKAIGNFLSLTNRLEKENNGVILIREFANSTGLADMGCDPKYLPGYVNINEPEEMERIQKTWDTDLTTIFKTVDIKNSLLKHKIKAVVIFGEDPLSEKENIKYFNGIEFMMVVDNFKTVTSEEADVLIPGGAFIEQEGTVTSCDTMIQYATPVISIKDKPQNWEVISRFAALFSDGFDFESYEAVFEEMKAVNRHYAVCNVNEYWNKAEMNRKFFAKGNHKKFLIYDAGLDILIQRKHNFHHSDKYYKNMVQRLLSV